MKVHYSSLHLYATQLTFIGQVYLAAVAGYLPSAMVQCLLAFIDACYIARRNVITASALERFQQCIARFHKLRQIFINTGVRTNISLPRQHALFHYYRLIQLFGSPNGLCSSITESKHIKAVKEPWRRSSRFKALAQMLQSIIRMKKMAALHRRFAQEGLLRVSLTAHIKVIRQQTQKRKDGDCDHDDEAATDDNNNNSENDDGYSTTSSSGSESDRDCHCYGIA